MKEIMIATSNLHKVEEFKTMLEPLGYHVKSLLDLKETIDIEENGQSFEENALIKAKTLYEHLHIEVMADDSGLAINHLDGAPGIYSARFLGYDTSYEEKNNYIMKQLEHAQDRGAQYVCAIAYVNNEGNAKVYRGVVEGEISKEAVGTRGFGYDPIFYYPEFKTTLANVSEEQKNSISHRGKALRLFLEDYMKENA